MFPPAATTQEEGCGCGLVARPTFRKLYEARVVRVGRARDHSSGGSHERRPIGEEVKKYLLNLLLAASWDANKSHVGAYFIIIRRSCYIHIHNPSDSATAAAAALDALIGVVVVKLGTGGDTHAQFDEFFVSVNRGRPRTVLKVTFL